MAGSVARLYKIYCQATGQGQAGWSWALRNFGPGLRHRAAKIHAEPFVASLALGRLGDLCMHGQTDV